MLPLNYSLEVSPPKKFLTLLFLHLGVRGSFLFTATAFDGDVTWLKTSCSGTRSSLISPPSYVCNACIARPSFLTFPFAYRREKRHDMKNIQARLGYFWIMEMHVERKSFLCCHMQNQHCMHACMHACTMEHLN